MFWWPRMRSESNVKQARHFMELAQRRQATRDARKWSTTLECLSTKNLRMKPGKAKKLLPRFIGPFKVLEH
ncbi:hypothetical protein HaLaN_20265, partial [Haematococcus lacustris]